RAATTHARAGCRRRRRGHPQPVPAASARADHGCHTARRRASRPPRWTPEIASRLQVVVTDDLVAGYDAFRFRFAPYYANPVYNRFLAWAGFEAEAAAILEAGAAAD